MCYCISTHLHMFIEQHRLEDLQPTTSRDIHEARMAGSGHDCDVCRAQHQVSTEREGSCLEIPWWWLTEDLPCFESVSLHEGEVTKKGFSQFAMGSLENPVARTAPHTYPHTYLWQVGEYNTGHIAGQVQILPRRCIPTGPAVHG